ncbi:unnamed protein product [Lymnaea stagnalis]|uniref:Uncharacterized protein n=1 Tax=Lymnaea stagnalis TaxID=6523 RepID=A0AAV2I9W9_LYMST
MSLFELLVHLFRAGAVLLPTKNFDTHQLTTQDFHFIETLPTVTSERRLPGFQYVYLDPDRRLTATRSTGHRQLEIAASPQCSRRALRVAADVVQRMSEHMPASMFRDLTRGSVGIFTSAEKLTVYPEMQSLASGDCVTSCLGRCSRTCSFDGRKYEDMDGLTNSRSVVLDDAVLCARADPHRGALNVLVHEFAHLVYNYAVTPAVRAQIASAYDSARRHATWGLTSYAMANEREYWAAATAAFFGVTLEDGASTGGMNRCGAAVCPSVRLARDHLRARDPALFDVLTHVLASNNSSLDPRIARCPAQSAVGK